jgi:hypothetical protein
MKSKELVLIVAAAAVLLALTEAATARIASNTVEPTAGISKQGARAEVGVLLGCDTVQRARLRVTVTQRSEDRGSVAQGRRRVRCTTEQERFPVKVEARRQSRFEPGEATACVLALAADDARQWCKDITLE